jgi:CheY-like chemotaxis protein
MSDGKRLLIIDDDPDFADGIKAILDHAGYQTDAVYDPKEGWRILEERRHDLLLLDIMMGRGAEGIAIARRLGKDPALRDLPVLIITGIKEQMAFLFPGQPVHPGFVEVDEVVEKPVDPRMLIEKVETLLGRARARHEGS